MATTSTFYVDSKTGGIKPIESNPREYWRPGGKFEGQADYIIEVFATDIHLKHAQYLHHVMRMGNLDKRYFHIKIEVK